MEMRNIAIAMGVFLLLVGGFLAFVIIYGADDGAPGQGTDTTSGQPEGSANKSLEDRVLAGYTVKFWGEGRPFVSYYDPGAGEFSTTHIADALFWQAQYAAGGDMGGMGAPPPQHFDGSEAAYRLGLINEHGLFGYSVNRGEAMRYYRIAKVGGHSGGAEGENRLMSASEK